MPLFELRSRPDQPAARATHRPPRQRSILRSSGLDAQAMETDSEQRESGALERAPGGLGAARVTTAQVRVRRPPVRRAPSEKSPEANTTKSSRARTANGIEGHVARRWRRRRPRDASASGSACRPAGSTRAPRTAFPGETEPPRSHRASRRGHSGGRRPSPSGPAPEAAPEAVMAAASPSGSGVPRRKRAPST
jgi:hypothetical protein